MTKTRHGAPSRKRKELRPVTVLEALAMLESAVSYCQSAGLKVRAANGDNGTLQLIIPGAHYVLTDGGTRAALRLGPVSVQGQAQGIGTPAATVLAQAK